MWVDYTVEQGVNKFRVRGDTPTEVMDKGLYSPEDIFVVNAEGWLVKVDELSALTELYDRKKNEM